jgi:hypothetical protein
MNRNLAGSIYGRSSLKIAYFVLIRYQTWLPQTILVSSLVQRTFPLVPDNRTNVIVEACGFRGDDFLEINQSEPRIVCGGHVS